jgi:uncharacterized protein YgiM (DUF1202 family)
MRCALVAGLIISSLLFSARSLEAQEQTTAAEMSRTGISDPGSRDAALKARDAAEVELRQLSPAPDTVRLRHIGVFRQSALDTIAVCGQVSPTGGENAFVDFVAVVMIEQPGGTPRVREVHLADRPDRVARAAADGFLRCSDESKRINVTADAHLPSGSLTSQRGQSRSEAQSALPGSMVVVRRSGNLRSGPQGGSAVTRIIPGGTMVQIFRTAPAGWYQIGDTAPWGWMHGSILFGP